MEKEVGVEVIVSAVGEVHRAVKYRHVEVRKDGSHGFSHHRLKRPDQMFQNLFRNQIPATATSECYIKAVMGETKNC